MPRPCRPQTAGTWPVVLAKVMHLRETRDHPLITATQPPARPPSQPEGPIRATAPTLQPAVQHPIVVITHRTVMATQHSWGRGDQSKQIDHHQASIPPGLRETTQPAQRRVIRTGISSRGIESAENQGVAAPRPAMASGGITPATLQHPAIPATGAECGPSTYHWRRDWHDQTLRSVRAASRMRALA